MAVTVMSLCSGIGGLDLGLKLAVPDARTVVYVEREAFCVHALLQRMEEGLLDLAPVWTDLVTFDARPWRGAVDLIVGGYPCQPFSTAGKRLGEKDPRHLWPRIRSIVEEVQPPYVFFENVPGHVSLGLREVLSDLVDLGYRVESPEGEPSFGLFSAAEVGATHRRERLFIIGKLGDGSGERLEGRGGYEDAGQRISRPTGGTLGDASGHGLHDPENHGEGSGDQITRVRGQESSGAGGERVRPLLPAWPPGPDDLDAWREVLAIDPSVEPSLCRVAHGVPDRVDRLRALGNAVVPAVAAHAWRTLWRRMNK